MADSSRTPETVKPTIEYSLADALPRETMSPASQLYDQWASCISEGWCPLYQAPMYRHRLFPCNHPDQDHAGEAWLVCEAGAYFRLVQPERTDDA